MIVLHSATLLAAFNAGRADLTTAAALHRVQAAVLLANGHTVPDAALPGEVRARIAEEVERKQPPRNVVRRDATDRLSAEDVTRINAQVQRARKGRAA